MHKNNYFCNFLSKNYFFIEKNLKRNFGCRPAGRFISFFTKHVGRPTSKIPFQKFDGAKSVFSNFIKKYVKNEKSGLIKF